MAVTISRTPWTDDDGTGTTGTVINNAVKTELYNQIDAAIANMAVLNAANVFTSYLQAASGVRATGASGFTGAGAGAELIYSGGTAILQGYDRTVAGYTALGLIGSSFSMVDGASGAARFALTGAGAARFSAYGAGTATFDASGNITSVSDERLKDRIAPLPYGLAEVLALEPIQHGWTKASKLERRHLYGGFGARAVQRVMPLAVGRNKDGMLTFMDRPVLGALVNAVKELHADVAALKARRAA